MIRALHSAWIWFASVSLMILWLPLVALTRVFERDPMKRRTARVFRSLGRAIARVNPWRLHITGTAKLQPGGVYVLVANHQSLADIPLVSHIRLDTKWLGKAELFKVPVAGWMMSLANDIPVQRADRRKAAQALLKCASVLRQGISMVFFPEGTRSRDGSVLPFNDGPFQLAIREQRPVLPLAIEGSGTALPRDTWLFGATQDIYLSVLDPVPVEGLEVRRCGELRDAVREKIAAEVERLRGLKQAPTA